VSDPDPEYQELEAQALAALSKPDASPEEIDKIASDRRLATNRKVRMALVQHAKTPRHISLALLRKLYALELTEVVLSLKTPPAVKHSGEEELIRRLEGISAGERTTLARRASGAVASALLHDKENNIVSIALDNGRLTEALVVKALHREGVRPAVIELISRHSKWSRTQQVMIALMRHPATPLARIVEYAKRLPRPVLRDVMRNTRFNENVRKYLDKIVSGQA
jgi:hypothetical protein